MPNVAIYHNPRCSKSRRALALLEERGIQPTVIEYLQNPPTPDVLKKLLQQLGLSARELMRKKESAYEENQLDNPNLTEDELIKAMLDHPILIERPIVVINDKAALGRPPEAILELL